MFAHYSSLFQEPVSVNMNGIPSPKPGTAVLTQEVGPQVHSYSFIQKYIFFSIIISHFLFSFRFV